MKITYDKIPHAIPMPNNMGIVRYILAFIVFWGHYHTLNGNEEYGWLMYYSVGGFFALSGFLTYNSYHRQPSFKKYVINRLIRLLPAYITVVLLSAFGLGVVSTLPLGEYYTSSGLYKYLVANLLMVNFIEPTLPGVFSGNIISAVNGALWTMKVEVALSLLFPIIMWVIKRFRFNMVVAFTVLYLISAAYTLTLLQLYSTTGREVYYTFSKQIFGQFMFFSAGVMVYLYYSRVMQFRWPLLAVSALMLVACRYMDLAGVALEPIFLIFILIILSMSARRYAFEGKNDNISYNIYLVHFPIIQLLFSLGALESLGKWGTFVVAAIIVIMLSIAIRKFIEKPIMRVEKRYR